MKSIILLAGAGKRLRGTTENPKCLLGIGGMTLLERYLSALGEMNISDVALVVGYKKEMIIKLVKDINSHHNLKFIENPDFQKGSILSLYRASDELEEDTLLMDGDVYFEAEVLARLVNSEKENLIAIDTTSSSSGEEMMVGVKQGRIIDMKRDLTGNYDSVGEAVGFYKFNKQAGGELKQILAEQIKLRKNNLGYEDILPLLFKRVIFEPVIVDGLKWLEIDFEEDVRRAEELTRER